MRKNFLRRRLRSTSSIIIHPIRKIFKKFKDDSSTIKNMRMKKIPSIFFNELGEKIYLFKDLEGENLR